ncbi:hypothetical protein LSTR_LSTR016638 [Laodelphax striatellus]|uniref:Uncharacterized protein n=1 Tax=Laodelphax striatellus TaxID=195883 RepID=A0A482X5U2_LAOST|nr:hypothetical protein LSTR_LSTR016638 [Laodelphax striatellus]
MTTLSAELKGSDTNYRIIRRRIALLLGQWTCVKFARHLRPALYVAMLALLHCGEDCVVRLTAANTVKSAVCAVEGCARMREQGW